MPRDDQDSGAVPELDNPPSTDPAMVETTKPDAVLQEPPTPRKSNAAAILIACAILVLPVVYLFFHHAAPAGTSVLEGVTQTSGASNIASLEALVRSAPTKENRINLSLAYINGGAPARAIPVLQTVVAEDKSNVIAWNDLCVAHTLQNDFVTAIDECNTAIALSPGFQLARNNLKWSSDEKAKTIAAIDAANQSTTPHDAPFYLAQGLNELHVGNYDEAIAAWQHTLQLDPKNAIAANDIGIAYMQKKQPGEAIPWFTKAAEFDPSMQLAKNNLTWARDEQAKTAK